MQSDLVSEQKEEDVKLSTRMEDCDTRIGEVKNTLMIAGARMADDTRRQPLL
jgi:hypothetical protein